MTTYTKKVTTTIVGQESDISQSPVEIDGFISTMISDGKTPASHNASVNTVDGVVTIVTSRYFTNQAAVDEYIAFGQAMDVKYNRTTTSQSIEDVNIEI